MARVNGEASLPKRSTVGKIKKEKEAPLQYESHFFHEYKDGHLTMPQWDLKVPLQDYNGRRTC